jgi:hypothetical protein
MVVIALTGGSVIFLVVIVVLVVAVAFSYYTYRGSGISAHPHDGRDQAPGAGGPSDPAAPGRIPEDPDRLGGEGSISTHGTK